MKSLGKELRAKVAPAGPVLSTTRSASRAKTITPPCARSLSNGSASSGSAGTPATPYNEVVYLESLRKKGSSLLKFAMPPDFLSSNSDAARITGLSVRFECDDAGAN